MKKLVPEVRPDSSKVTGSLALKQSQNPGDLLSAWGSLHLMCQFQLNYCFFHSLLKKKNNNFAIDFYGSIHSKYLPPLGVETGNDILINYLQPETRSPWASWARVLEDTQFPVTPKSIYTPLSRTGSVAQEVESLFMWSPEAHLTARSMSVKL